MDIEKSSNGEQLKRHKAKGSFEASENVKKSKNKWNIQMFNMLERIFQTSIKLSLYALYLLNRHIKSRERANSSFSKRQFDNNISDGLFILSKVYASSYS